MIARSQARIIDEEFLLVLNRIELTFDAAVCDQNAFAGHALIPMGEHLGNGSSRLMERIKFRTESMCSAAKKRDTSISAWINKFKQLSFVLLIPGTLPFSAYSLKQC
jgi:hypothetical protein